MCGIVFKHNFDKKKPVNNDILQQFDAQRKRGTQGFGLFDGQEMHMVHAAKEDRILNWLCKYESSLILFHHRYPTSTVNVKKAAHPFSTHDYFGKTQYILVHNGSITNADELYVEHQEKGIEYQSMLQDMTFNDSEALMWDLTLYLEGKQKEVKAVGAMAFVILKQVNGKLVSVLFGRNTRPLNIRHTKDSIALSSEGEGVSILTNTMYEFNFKTHKTDKTSVLLPQYQYKGPTPSLYPALPAYARHENEYESYDEFYAKQHGIKRAKTPEEVESTWQALRRKYGKKTVDSASMVSVSKILESKSDTIDIDQLDIRDYSPTSSEIQRCAMDYMVEAEGNFEGAYALLEFEYAEHQEETTGHETFADVRQTLLFEAAMAFINSDPEYQNEYSISSLWHSHQFQQQVTAPLRLAI